MKIGILTFHAADNHGGVLQCMALQNIINMIVGEDCTEIIDFRLPGSNINLEELGENAECYRERCERSKSFVEFREKFLQLTDKEFCDYNELKMIANRYDILVVGSDQVWNKHIISGLEKIYFLKWGNSTRKISYAASVGCSDNSGELASWLQENVKAFDYISVREEISIHSFGVLENKVKCCIDPTLLWNSNYWGKFERKPENIGLDDEYVFMYALGHSWNYDEELIASNMAKKIAEKEKLKICHNYWGDYKKRFADDAINCYFTNPSEFLWIMHHAKYVICCSFHGTAFSLVYEKPFYSVHTGGNGSRMLGLCELAGIRERCITEELDSTEMDMEIDWASVRSNLEKVREESLEFLHKAIVGE